MLAFHFSTRTSQDLNVIQRNLVPLIRDQCSGGDSDGGSVYKVKTQSRFLNDVLQALTT
jgi:hypothetical protein